MCFGPARSTRHHARSPCPTACSEMSQIAQVQITFAAAEDRLLMRMTTNAREEFRFWLTRRFVAALRPHLGKSLSSRPRISTQPSAGRTA